METAQTADYALRVLLELELHDGQSASELSNRLDLSRPIVQRIITTLHRRALVSRAQDGSYRLGPGLIALGRNLTHEIAEIAQPVISELARSTREMIVLAVPVGDEAVVVARHNGSRGPLQVEFTLGFRHPLTRGASGLAILAFLDRDSERVSPADLASLETVRSQGFALTRGELREHMVGLGCPVLVDGIAVASMAIVVPSVRAERLQDHLAGLRDAASAVSATYEQSRSPRRAPKRKQVSR